MAAIRWNISERHAGFQGATKKCCSKDGSPVSGGAGGVKQQCMVPELAWKCASVNQVQLRVYKKHPFPQGTVLPFYTLSYIRKRWKLSFPGRLLHQNLITSQPQPAGRAFEDQTLPHIIPPSLPQSPLLSPPQCLPNLPTKLAPALKPQSP